MPEGNAADGARWFKLNRCNGCHGENGSGGKGPMIAGTSLSFNRFLHKLREPNSAIMPTFESKRLSDKDAGEIYLWLLQQKKQE
ncbi:MAG: cytochrome c [Desulfobulbaceae bacterium]|nr:cytochrome c [Desulfobulbaceae bacterium]